MENKISKEDAFIHLLIAVDTRLEDIKNILTEINTNLIILIEKTNVIIDKTNKSQDTKNFDVKDKVLRWLKLTKN